MMREGIFDHHTTEPYITALANATPTAQNFYGPCPAGYAWYVEAATFHLSAHTAVAELAVSNGSQVPAIWDRQNREWWFGAAAVDGAVGPSNAWYVPEGYFLVAFWSGGTLAQNDVATMSFQIAVHQLNPRAMMSPEDMRAVRAEHERAGSPLTESAVAGRRAT